jgi:VIT1/CCC1 family predicted Fe2+/Mn2+ transporter
MKAQTPTTSTPLGRAARTSVGGGGTTTPGPEHHDSTNSLRDVILGGQDGLVNMLGIALGVVAAGGSTHILIAAGLSAKTLVGDWRRSGLQMVVIGLGAAALGFLIARLFHTAGS